MVAGTCSLIEKRYRKIHSSLRSFSPVHLLKVGPYSYLLKRGSTSSNVNLYLSKYELQELKFCFYVTYMNTDSKYKEQYLI